MNFQYVLFKFFPLHQADSQTNIAISHTMTGKVISDMISFDFHNITPWYTEILPSVLKLFLLLDRVSNYIPVIFPDGTYVKLFSNLISTRTHSVQVMYILNFLSLSSKNKPKMNLR